MTSQRAAEDDGDAYYRRATTWALDETASLKAALRWSRVFSAAAAVVAVFEAAALILLVPLKTLVPIPVLVDRETGFVEVLRNDGRPEIEANDALTRSLIAQYVVGREEFDINRISDDYRKTNLLSVGDARRGYLTLMAGTNPVSPLRHYPRDTVVEVRVKSLSPLGSKTRATKEADTRTYLARFDTRRRDAGGREGAARSWVAVVTYRFSNAPMSVEARLLNPLGLQVVEYHRDGEAPPPSEFDPSTELSRAAPAPNMTAVPSPPTTSIDTQGSVAPIIPMSRPSTPAVPR